jgi:hypothetical protein
VWCSVCIEINEGRIYVRQWTNVCRLFTRIYEHFEFARICEYFSDVWLRAFTGKFVRICGYFDDVCLRVFVSISKLRAWTFCIRNHARINAYEANENTRIEQIVHAHSLPANTSMDMRKGSHCGVPLRGLYCILITE